MRTTPVDSLRGAHVILLLAMGTYGPSSPGQNLGPHASADAPSRPNSGDTDTGRISGVVVYQGEIPKQRVADDGGERRMLLEVDRKTRGLRYVVAFLGPAQSATVRTDSAKRVANERLPPVVIDQRDHTFVPHLIAVGDQQTVKFTNSDMLNHNVRSATLNSKNEFNIYTGSGVEYEHRVHADPKGRPILLTCDIHPWMRAWVYVFDHPYFGVTDKLGKFKIESVVPGKYRLTMTQPDIGYRRTQDVVVSANKTTQLAITIRRQDVKDP